MALTDEFESQGKWLFRWRSYLPLLMIVPFAFALRDYRWPFDRYAVYSMWSQFCFGVSVAGFIIRCLTIGYAPAGTSGRNTATQIADQLNTTGMYSIVRHPLYLGNFLIGLGISSAPLVWWLPTLYCLLFCCYYERIMFVEEAFLRRKFGHHFDEWAATTPAFLPRRLKWIAPDLPFSLKTVLRREYTGLLVVIFGSAAVQFSEHLIVDRCVVYETFWVTLLAGGGTTYVMLRSLKKYTRVLDVPGR